MRYTVLNTGKLQFGAYLWHGGEDAQECPTVW